MGRENPASSSSATPPVAVHRNSGAFFGAHDYDDDDDGAPGGPGFRRGPTSYNSPVTPRAGAAAACSRPASPAPPPLPAGPPPLSPCGGPPAGFSASGIMRRSARGEAGAGAGAEDAAVGAVEAPPSPMGTAGGFEPAAAKVRGVGGGGRGGRTVWPMVVGRFVCSCSWRNVMYLHLRLHLSRP